MRIETPPTVMTSVLSMSSPNPGNSTATGRPSATQCLPIFRSPTLPKALRSVGEGGGQRSKSVAWYSPPAQYSSAVPPTTMGAVSMSFVIAAARRRRRRSSFFSFGIRPSKALACRRSSSRSLTTRSPHSFKVLSASTGLFKQGGLNRRGAAVPRVKAAWSED